MSDHLKPTLTSTYTNFVTEMMGRIDDAVKWLRSDQTTPTNPPTYSIRWNSTSKILEHNTGTPASPNWQNLTGGASWGIYTARADQWTTTRTIALTTGDATSTAVNIDGSGNISMTGVTLATVNSIGATPIQYGSTTAIPVITIDQKGRITAVSTATLGSIATQNSTSVTIGGGTISSTAINLVAGTAPTVQGRLEYNTTTNRLLTGTGSSTKTFAAIDDTVTLTNHTWNGVTIGAAYGGTGVNTLTGIPYGNGTSPFTVATTAQIVGLTGAVTGLLYGNGTSARTVATTAQIGSAINVTGILKGAGAAAITAASGTDITTLIGTNAVTNATNATNLTGSGSISGTTTGTTQTYGDATTKLATTAFVDALRDVPQQSKSAQYTLALTDRGQSIDITTGGILIPTNASVAFPVGATISVFNNSGSAQNIAAVTPGTTTVRKAGTAITGTISLSQYGVATMRKVDTDVWVVSGSLA